MSSDQQPERLTVYHEEMESGEDYDIDAVAVLQVIECVRVLHTEWISWTTVHLLPFFRSERQKGITLFRFPLAGRLSVVAPSFLHYIRPGHSYSIVRAFTIDFTFISSLCPSHPSPCSLIKPFDGTGLCKIIHVPVVRWKPPRPQLRVYSSPCEWHDLLFCLHSCFLVPAPLTVASVQLSACPKLARNSNLGANQKLHQATPQSRHSKPLSRASTGRNP